MKIEFTIPGEVVPWARAGAHGKRRFTPKRQTDYMATIRSMCADAMAGRPPVEGPVELKVMAVFPVPKSWSAKKKAAALKMWKTTKPDLDNIVKIAKDAMNQIAYLDDAQVCSSHEWKVYGELPRLVISVEAVPEG